MKLRLQALDEGEIICESLVVSNNNDLEEIGSVSFLLISSWIHAQPKVFHNKVKYRLIGMNGKVYIREPIGKRL